MQPVKYTVGAVILNSTKLEKVLAGNKIFGSTGICVMEYAQSHCSNLRSLDLENIHMDELIVECLHLWFAVAIAILLIIASRNLLRVCNPITQIPVDPKMLFPTMTFSSLGEIQNIVQGYCNIIITMLL